MFTNVNADKRWWGGGRFLPRKKSLVEHLETAATREKVREFWSFWKDLRNALDSTFYK